MTWYILLTLLFVSLILVRESGSPGSRESGSPGSRESGSPGSRESGSPGSRESGVDDGVFYD